MQEPEDLKETLYRAAVKADALRAAGMNGLAGVMQARQAGLDREHRRLFEKVGAEHPRVRTLALRIEDVVARLHDLRVEIARAETPGVRAGPAEWVLHGYVWRKDLSAAPDLTVALVDSQGEWVRAFGYTCSDARGYFQLVASLGRAEPTGETARLTMSAPPPQFEAQVRISDANHVQLYRGGEAVPISPGGVEYREIVLGDSARGCVAPEDGPLPRPVPKEKT
jgi:hypothetical protein